MSGLQDLGQVRRVVTGHEPSGKAVVVSDGPAGKQRQSDDFSRATVLWITDRGPADFDLAGDGAEIPSGFPPPPLGTRFGILDIAPGNPGFWHQTDTVDYVICLRGTVDLAMEGSTVTLKEGDVVVQRGTKHAWINRGTVPARLAYVLVDAEPKRPDSLK